MVFKKSKKAKAFILVISLIALFLLVSCRNPASGVRGEGGDVKVIFYLAGGTPEIEPQIVPVGGRLEPVEAPRRTGHRFMGWYADQYWAYRWDFDNGVVTENKVLYARWQRAGGGGGGGGGGGVGSPGVTNPGGGDIPIRVPGSANKTVYEQLEWMHANSATHIQGGPDRVYIVTAYYYNNLNNSQTINSNFTPINFTAANPGDPVRVRIVSYPPASQWGVQMNGFDIRLEVANDNILELENVALVGLPGLAAIPHPIVRVQSDGTLVMREGSVIRNNNSGRGVHVNGGTFRMYNGAAIRNNAGGVYVTGSSGTFTMVGGTIGGIGGQNSALAGGGVLVSGGAEFEMTGGTISHNEATNNVGTTGGGGVHLTGAGSEFRMYGGNITANVSSLVGGGVDVQANTTFIMYGGTISSNIADGGAPASHGGGGVHLVGANSRFEMHDGTISGNFGIQGGGIRLDGFDSSNLSRFIMHGGTINGNTATQQGGGVKAWNASRFEMHGGTIGPGNNANQGGGVSLHFPTTHLPGIYFTMTGGTISGNQATNQGGGVWLSLASRFRIYSPGSVHGVNGSPPNTSGDGVSAAVSFTAGINSSVTINGVTTQGGFLGNINNTIP